MARTYLIDGAPYGLDETKLTKVHGKHNFSDAKDQALCIDSLAGFAKEGFLLGPLELGSVDAPKLVGAFTREQESSQKKRCISDLSQPRTGGSFNDALSLKPVTEWPMLNPGTVQATIILILDNGEAHFTKIDVGSAYKLIAIQKEQRRFQVYRFGKALFMDLCLLFGDCTAAHIFTGKTQPRALVDLFANTNITPGTHRAIIENFVLPHIRGHRKNLILVVDDSVFVAGNLQWVEEYNARYREVMGKLNLEVRLMQKPNPR